MVERINRAMAVFLGASLALNAGLIWDRAILLAPRVGDRVIPIRDLDVPTLRKESKRLGLPAYQRDGQRLSRDDLIEQLETVERAVRKLADRIEGQR